MNSHSQNATEIRDSGVAELLRHGAAALSHLLHSVEYAHEVGCDAWEFALNIDCLQRDGLREADLRWLLKKGLIQQACEQTRLSERTRRFRPLPGMKFCKHSCFLLTEQGAKTVAALLKSPLPRNIEASTPADAVPPNREENGVLKPVWDRNRRMLSWSNHLVKQFKVAAPNQETILAAFQEEHWPPRIDDPLPPSADTESKRRLHDTIVSLNRHRKLKVVRFLGETAAERGSAGS